MQNCETMLEPRVESVSGRFYEIADRLLSVETDADWTTRLADTFFSGLHLSPSLGRDTGPVHLQLKITTEPPPPLPTQLERFEVPGGVCYKNHQSYYLEVKDSRIAVGARNSKQVKVWLGNTARARTRASLITVMAYAVPAALRRIGLYDLHAAALIEPESGLCFLFPGPSGSGKTSLSLRLAASGWHYLSDDMVVMSERNDGIEARGLRRPFQTSDDSLAGHELPRLDDALTVTIPNDSVKRRLDPEILFPGQFAASARPRVLCFPVITGECQSRLEETTKADSMMRLILMCPWSNYDSSSAREHLRVLSHLVRQCQTFTLHAGRDIFDEPNGASALLSRLVKEV
ncbi:MAG: hypothetical protein ND895_14095 [Pyrinomonadaceae bacterium]|nr:hypothetical protein [Pyrinomonadaceae bacterium]